MNKWSGEQRGLFLVGVTLATLALCLAFGFSKPPLVCLFIGAVALATHFAGVAGGCVATLLSVIGANHFLTDPLQSASIRDAGVPADDGIFVFAALGYSLLLDRLCRASALAKQDELRDRAWREQWQQILEVSPAAFCSFRCDRQGQVSFPFSTPSIKEFFAMEPAALAIDGRPTLALFNPQDLQRLQVRFAQAARQLLPWHETWRVKHPLKGEIWVEGHLTPVRQADASTLWHGMILDITQRKHAEAAIERSGIANAQLVNQLPQLVWTCTPAGEYDFLNDRWTQFTGIPPGKQLGHRWLEQVHPDDRFSLMEKWAVALAQGIDFRMTFRIRRYDGVYHWFDIWANPLRDDTGHISKWFGSNTDVQITHDLNERLARQALLLDLSLEPVLIWSLRGGIEYWNKGCEQCYGFSASEALGRKSNGLLRTRMPGGEPCFTTTLLQNGTWSGEVIHSTKSGASLTVLSRMQVVDYQGRQLVLESNCDITERKKMEEVLRLWAETFERAEFALAITDAVTNTFKAVNATYARERGYSPEELQGQSVFSIYPADRLLETEKFVADLDQYGHGTFESEHLTKDGRRFPVRLDITTLKDRAGQPQSRIACTFDITEQKAAETARELALHEAERLAQVRSEFLANMSHEIRTPLNAILGFAQVGVRDSKERLIHKTFVHVLTAGKQLLGIVDDILDFSKIEAGKLVVEQHRFALSAMLDNAIALVAAQAYAKGLDFQVHEAPDLPEFVIGDPLRIGQVLGNLLANAVKFTAGGRVTLTIATTPSDLLFAVQDTGIGMSSDTLSRLFQAFSQADGSTTRRFGGTGLGLMICRRLVDLMQGSITVSSELGTGSTFEVCIPLTAADPSPRSKPSGQVVLAGLPAAEADGFRDCLSEHGFTVFIAAPEHACTVTADLCIMDSRVWSEPPVRKAIDTALARQQNLALLCTPGNEGTEHEQYRERVQLLERPLRVSSVVRTLRVVPGATLPAPRRGRLSGLSILAIDDEEVNRTVLAELLRFEGARLFTAADGQAALDQLNSEGPQRYDVVLTDIQMPHMDGYETTRRIHDLAPALPVIGLTAHALPEERNRCLNAGMLAHLTKPVDLDTLVAAIKYYIAPRDPNDGPAPGAAVQPAPEPSSPVPETHAPVDWTALELRFANRPAFVSKLCKILLSSHAETGNRLREAAKRDDCQALASLAHGLNGVSANLGAKSVQALAADLEEAANTPARQPHAIELAERLAKAVEALLTAATAYLQQPAANSPDIGSRQQSS